MAIRLRSNSLVYPGGNAALNSSHPMAQGAQYAGVSAPGGAFIDLLTGKATTPTNGTPTTAVQAQIGPATVNSTSTSYNSVTNSFAATPTAVTIAAIFVNTGSNSNLFCSEPALVQFGNALLTVANVLNFELQGFRTPALTLLANNPYFAAVSIMNGLQNLVLVNLATGQVTTFVASAAHAVNNRDLSFSVGGTSVASYTSSILSAAAYSVNNFMTIPQLLEWAAAPWDYWYPPALSNRLATIKLSLPGPNLTLGGGFKPKAQVVPNNPLGFPGRGASLNPRHPMAQGARYAGAAAPGGAFINLLTGAASVTTGGTLTTKISPVIGPAVLSSTSAVYNAVANSYADVPLSVTFGAIFVPTASVGFGELFSTIPAGGAGSSSIYLASKILALNLNNTAIPSGIPALTLNQPYFVAVSGRNGSQSFVVANLVTGQIWSAVASTVKTVGVGTSSWAVGGLSAASSYGGTIAAVAYSVNNFMSVQQLVTWAQSPWDYWYSPALGTILDGLRAVTSAAHNQALNWTTTSTLTAAKSVGKSLAWTTTSTLSAVATKVKLVAVAIATTSALAFTKAVAKVEAISTTSALAFTKAVAKAEAISTTSALTMAKAVGKTAAISTTSALSAIKGVAHKLAISTTSALTAVGSFISGSGTTYHQAVAIATSSALVLMKAVGKLEAISTTSALSLSKAAGKTAAMTTSGAAAFVKAVSKALAIATSSTVTTNNSGGKTVRFTVATSGGLTVARAVGKIMPISTGGAVAFVKAVSKALAIASSSALTMIRGSGHTASVAITTVSSVVVQKTVGKVVSIASASALSLGRGLGKVVQVTTASALSIAKAVAHSLQIATLSTLVAHAIKVKIVVVVITTVSAFSVSWHITRSCVVLISTVSSVIVGYLISFGRASLWLVGRALRVLLSGSGSRIALVGRMSQLELTGMSIDVDGKFYQGETWNFNGCAHDASGRNALDLTGATVQLRFFTDTAVALDLATPGDGSIVNPAKGMYQFLIGQVGQASLTLTSYRFEVRVTLADGTISVQNTGEITIMPSAFVIFP